MKLKVQKLIVLVKVKKKVHQVMLTKNEALMVLDLIRQMTNNYMRISIEIEGIKI